MIILAANRSDVKPIARLSRTVPRPRYLVTTWNRCREIPRKILQALDDLDHNHCVMHKKDKKLRNVSLRIVVRSDQSQGLLKEL